MVSLLHYMNDRDTYNYRPFHALPVTEHQLVFMLKLNHYRWWGRGYIIISSSCATPYFKRWQINTSDTVTQVHNLEKSKTFRLEHRAFSKSLILYYGNFSCQDMNTCNSCTKQYAYYFDKNKYGKDIHGYNLAVWSDYTGLLRFFCNTKMWYLWWI